MSIVRTHRTVRSRFINAVEMLESRRLLTSVVVNTLADGLFAPTSGLVSLRNAIAVANSSATATTITFDKTLFASARSIVLGGSDLELTNTKESTTITGSVAGVTVSGNGASRIFQVDAGVTVSILELSVIDGSADKGGGIYNAGILSLENATIANNTATGFDPINYDNGGGIFNSGKLSLVNCTVAGNMANLDGGGICNSGTMTLEDSTIFKNVGNTGGESSSAGPIGGGGIFSHGSANALTVANSILAQNSAARNVGPDAFGFVNSFGFNLVGMVDGSSGWNTADLTGTVALPLNAKLGALAKNGGPTETVLPLSGSPAINHGYNAFIPKGITTDQRGLPRIVNTTVDIGAVEVQATTPTIKITAPANQTATQNVSTKVALGSFTQTGGTSPFKDTIIWGDGSANTVLTLSAAGTIPATAHTFAKAGTFTVSETIADAKSNKSATVKFTETVKAPPATISGRVFDDVNGNGMVDTGEAGLGLFTVYIDANNNTKLDTGEKSVVTDIYGDWSFTGLAAGTYTIRVVPVTGLTATKPTGGVLTVKVTAGQTSKGNLLGEKATA